MIIAAGEQPRRIRPARAADFGVRQNDFQLRHIHNSLLPGDPCRLTARGVRRLRIRGLLGPELERAPSPLGGHSRGRFSGAASAHTRSSCDRFFRAADDTFDENTGRHAVLRSRELPQKIECRRRPTRRTSLPGSAAPRQHRTVPSRFAIVATMRSRARPSYEVSCKDLAWGRAWPDKSRVGRRASISRRYHISCLGGKRPGSRARPPLPK